MKLDEVLKQYLNKKVSITLIGNNIIAGYNGSIEEIGEGWIRFIGTDRFEYIIPTTAIASVRNSERREKKKYNE